MSAPYEERIHQVAAEYRRLAGHDAPLWVLDPRDPAFAPAYAAFRERPFRLDLGAHAGEEAMVRLGLKPMVRQVLPQDDFERFTARWQAEGLQVVSQPLPVSEDPVSGYTFDAAQRQRRAGRAARAAAEDRWIDRVAADSAPANKVLCYASEDADRLAEALRIDRELLEPGADERPRVARLGELLGYPRCCVESFAQHRKLHHNRVAIAASARRSERFDPLLNQLSLSLFHPIGWFPCRYDCPASLSLARQLMDAMAGPMLPARDAALRMLSMPRIYWDDRRQVLLDGARIERDSIAYEQVWTPWTFDRSASSADLDWLFFADVVLWLRSGDRVAPEGSELVLFSGDAEIDRRPFDGLVLPFSSERPASAASPDGGQGQVHGGIASLPVLNDGYRPEHLEEAVTVTTRGDATQLEIQLGHLCNNRCVFCVSGQLTQDRMAPPIDLEPILGALRDGAELGVTKLTFLGGEPTIQRSFLPALDAALELGYDDITIFTNGVRGRNQRFLDDVCSRGRFTWRLSIQGGNEAAHDAVTERPGSFAKILDAIAGLGGLDQELTANLCVNERSYRSLPDFPELVARTGVSQLHLDVIRPSGAGRRTDSYLRSIMPRFSDMAPYFARMLERFEQQDPGYDVNVGNLPYCVLPEWSHQVHHGGELTLTVAADQDRLDRVWNKYAFQRSDMVFGDRCGDCVFWGQCRGVPDKYAAFYGTDELQPVTMERLAELDPQRRNFAVLVSAHVARIEEGTPPAPWRLDRVFRDRRERRVELPFVGAQAQATLVLEPPETSGEAVAAGPEFRLVLRADGLQGRIEDVAALLRWASRLLLDTEPDLSVLQPSGAAGVRALNVALRALEGGDAPAALRALPELLPPALQVPAARLQALADDPVGALQRLDALPPRLAPAADRLRVELCGRLGWNHEVLAALARLDSPVARRRAAGLLARNGDWRGALAQLDALQPWTEPELAWKAAELRCRLRDSEGALEALGAARALRSDPEAEASLLAFLGREPDSPAQESERLLEQIRVLPAERVLEALHELERRAPDSPMPSAHRGRLLLWIGRPEDALAEFDRCQRLAPGEPRAVFGRAACEAMGGRPGPALAALDAGRRAGHALDASARVVRAEALEQLGRHAEARDQFERAAAHDPAPLGAWIGLALARSQTGDPAGRDAMLDRLRRRAPALLAEAGHLSPAGDPDALLRSARGLLRGNRSGRCITWFDRNARLRLVPPQTHGQDARRAKELAVLRALLARLR